MTTDSEHFEDVIIILCVRWYLRYGGRIGSGGDRPESQKLCGKKSHVPRVMGHFTKTSRSSSSHYFFFFIIALGAVMVSPFKSPIKLTVSPASFCRDVRF
jgi:hypothetical protein